jgi:DNA-binding phage protein
MLQKTLDHYLSRPALSLPPLDESARQNLASAQRSLQGLAAVLDVLGADHLVYKVGPSELPAAPPTGGWPVDGRSPADRLRLGRGGAPMSRAEQAPAASPQAIVDQLQACLQDNDGDPKVFIAALAAIAENHGLVTLAAQCGGVSATTLRRRLCGHYPTSLPTVMRVLRVLGIRLQVQAR